MDSKNAKPAEQARRKAYLEDLFRRHGVRPRKSLGQNFILDPNLLDAIVKAANVGPGDTVLEVGVGTGQLTSRLAERAGRVVGVELDPLLFRITGEILGPRTNVTLLNADALASKSRIAPELLEAVRAAPPAEAGRLLLVSNLAYSISTPLILGLLASDLGFHALTVTVQWELAEKLAAEGPGSKGWSSVAALARYHTNGRILRPVPPRVFWPAPKVRSAVVSLHVLAAASRRPVPYGPYRDLVRGLFTARRKTLHRALETAGFAGKGEGKALLERARIGGTRRPEELEFHEFLALAAATLA